MSDSNPTPDWLEALQSHKLFAGIELPMLEHFTQRMKEARYEAGDVILREGESGNRLYLIIEGNVDIVKKVLGKETVDQQVIATLGAGETFGEMELVDMQPRSATVRARQRVTVLSMSGMDLHAISDTDIKVFSLILMNLAREMSLRLRKTDTWLAGSLFSIQRYEGPEQRG